MNGLVQERQEAVDELRAVLRRFVADRDGLGQARNLLEGGGYDEATWAALSGQLGLTALTVPEEYDGAGAGWPEAVGVLVELGRAVLPSAYLATSILAGTAIAHAKDDTLQRELLPLLALGEKTATLAVLEGHGSWDLQSIGLRATHNEDGYRLDGTKLFVVDGHLADLVVVVGRTEMGLSLFVVDGNGPGLTRTRLTVLDPTRPQARLDFHSVPARLLGAEGQAERVLEETFNRAILAVAAEAVGGADRCLEMCLSYAKERVAFGRPIGGFQAVKHNLVDLYLEIELARAAVETAAASVEEERDLFPVYASVALGQATETFARVATETIHLHGGTGFTWEHDAQLFFRRATSSQVLFGDSAFHRERIARRLLGGPGESWDH
jgi:alkylation response protein AidB-like acyl-CoA dehydrogenase